MTKYIYSKEQKYLAEQLKKARIEECLDQEKVAKILGRSQSYVSKIESGQIGVDIFLLKEFAKIYKKNLKYFLYENNF